MWLLFPFPTGQSRQWAVITFFMPFILAALPQATASRCGPSVRVYRMLLAEYYLIPPSTPTVKVWSYVSTFRSFFSLSFPFFGVTSSQLAHSGTGRNYYELTQAKQSMLKAEFSGNWYLFSLIIFKPK